MSRLHHKPQHKVFNASCSSLPTTNISINGRKVMARFCNSSPQFLVMIKLHFIFAFLNIPFLYGFAFLLLACSKKCPNVKNPSCHLTVSLCWIVICDVILGFALWGF
ncbi:hypothetical protein VNO77_41473 [Canavalia gladiata]|uniref:Transmembrane protein n=1 Tax=Canavalia gladiata TaxID=3824 RepID=A0AAN9K139_CANGL